MFVNMAIYLMRLQVPYFVQTVHPKYQDIQVMNNFPRNLNSKFAQKNNAILHHYHQPNRHDQVVNDVIYLDE